MHLQWQLGFKSTGHFQHAGILTLLWASPVPATGFMSMRIMLLVLSPWMLLDKWCTSKVGTGKSVFFFSYSQLIFKIRCFLLRYDLDCFAEQTADLLKSIGWKLGIFSSFCTFYSEHEESEETTSRSGRCKSQPFGLQLGRCGSFRLLGCLPAVVYIACAGAVAVAFAHRYPERVSILDRILLWLVSGKQVNAMCKCTKATLIHAVKSP